jgi:hypothetical protein
MLEPRGLPPGSATRGKAWLSPVGNFPALDLQMFSRMGKFCADPHNPDHGPLDLPMTMLRPSQMVGLIGGRLSF